MKLRKLRSKSKLTTYYNSVFIFCPVFYNNIKTKNSLFKGAFCHDNKGLLGIFQFNAGVNVKFSILISEYACIIKFKCEIPVTIN